MRLLQFRSESVTIIMNRNFIQNLTVSAWSIVSLKVGHSLIPVFPVPPTDGITTTRFKISVDCCLIKLNIYNTL